MNDDWKFLQSFGDDNSSEGKLFVILYDNLIYMYIYLCIYSIDDLVTSITYDSTGGYIGVGDKAGRICLFEQNNVCLYQHCSDDVIGNWFNLRVIAGKLYGDLVLHELTDNSKLVKAYLDNNVLKAVSVGFISLETVAEPIPTDLKPQFVGAYNQTITNHIKSELLEVSVVTIPANKEALRTKMLSLLDTKEDVATKGTTIQTVAKIGKPISNSNLTKLKSMKDHLTQCMVHLSELLPEDPDDDDEEGGEYEPEIEYASEKPKQAPNKMSYQDYKKQNNRVKFNLEKFIN
jgi:phage head maturation protease